MKIKVLHYVPGFDHGGIESRLIDWYKGIDKNLYQLDLIVARNIDNNQLITQFKNEGGEVYEIPSFKIKEIIKFNQELSKIFRRNSYDVVHCHNPISGSLFLRQAKIHGVKNRIMHSRTNKFSENSSFLALREYLKRKTMKYSNINLACSESAGKWVFENQDFTIIKNGINTDKFKYNYEVRMSQRKNLGIKNNEIVLGNVARLTEIKNHKFMINILEYLKLNSEKNYKLLLIGDGPLKEELIQLVRSKNLTDSVLFMGKKEDVHNYYQAMDIFIFPSEHEGFGTVAIEAQNMGLKTITSTGVPKDVSITDLVTQLSLSAGTEKWGKTIDETGDYNRFDRSMEIEKKGYNVFSVIKKLEKIYSSQEGR